MKFTFEIGGMHSRQVLACFRIWIVIHFSTEKEVKVKRNKKYMLDICLVGTGGMMPLPRRWLTALMTRYNGSSLLIDCGEGTQVAIKEKGWSFKPIDVICFTHYHGDHISGLPGLLLTMGNADRTEPLTLIGPKGLERVVNALRSSVTSFQWINSCFLSASGLDTL